MDQQCLVWILDLLVEQGVLHSGQKQDVVNRGRDRARHILLDKRAEMRRLLGKQRVAYSVAEIELIAAFRFQSDQIEDGQLNEREITTRVAAKLELPFVELDPLKLDYKLVTEAFGGPFAERHLVIALDDGPKELVVALADPWKTEVLEQLKHFKQKPVRAVVAMKSAILQVIAEFHGFRRSMRAAAEEYRSDLPDLGNLEALYRVKGVNELDATDQPVVQAVWYLLNYAFEHRASDIHIEPKRDESYVRLRIDGILHLVHRLPKEVHAALVSRIKTLGRMDIAERRRPQDGRFKTRFRTDEIELRISIVPTAFGEKAVVRIFDPGLLLQDIENLGFFARERQVYERFVNATNGLIL
ncbi:MAG: Flp pilus assembly complex ATPase component, partial [Proteobacteria bacterium]|nr:Flp pilus assembly complex ATPase component [Pseudomonadota bacterium]